MMISMMMMTKPQKMNPISPKVMTLPIKKLESNSNP